VGDQCNQPSVESTVAGTVNLFADYGPVAVIHVPWRNFPSSVLRTKFQRGTILTFVDT